ncbi:MAG: hypothetical protein UT02_C0037G0004 [Parcubacteria group bacterium GW2011_GWC2_38_7]|nr:MAG: hypothetical protein UT02_C0037G0004 [Parcubacteria group bacterium GW2011_GWC2_38_7]
MYDLRTEALRSERPLSVGTKRQVFPGLNSLESDALMASKSSEAVRLTSAAFPFAKILTISKNQFTIVLSSRVCGVSTRQRPATRCADFNRRKKRHVRSVLYHLGGAHDYSPSSPAFFQGQEHLSTTTSRRPSVRSVRGSCTHRRSVAHAQTLPDLVRVARAVRFWRT